MQDFSRSNYKNKSSKKICHWSESQPHNSRPQPGSTEISVMLASQTTKESMSFFSSTHLISPSSVQPKSSPSATRQRNSKKSDAKFWLVQSTPNSHTWNTRLSQERKVALEKWTFHWSQTSTRTSQQLTAASVKTEEIKESHTEPPTSLIETVSSDIHQSTTFPSAEIPMSTWD